MSDFVPTQGDLFTVSESLNTPDRSYTRSIWVCVGVNNGHVMAYEVTDEMFGDGPYLFPRDDRVFFEANNFLNNITINDGC